VKARYLGVHVGNKVGHANGSLRGGIRQIASQTDRVSVILAVVIRSDCDESNGENAGQDSDGSR
jgi:hypothetical protein